MPEPIAANNPDLKPWLPVSPDSDFSLQNLPFGVFQSASHSPRVASAIGDKVVDLLALYRLGYFEALPFSEREFSAKSLNGLILKGKSATRALRNRLSQLLQQGNEELRGQPAHVREVFLPQNEVEMLLPINIGDYTDFYSSRQHAFNVGSIFRGPENALMPNWEHLPVGYHGRSSSIVVSGTNIIRPHGQMKPQQSDTPVFGPSQMLDFELEMAFFTFQGKPLGQPISTAEAEDYIFGMALFNDWSARDIQAWEYVPLGPFLGKNFASSLSPWIVTLDALQPFKIAGPEQIPAVLPYLQYAGLSHYNIEFETYLKAEGGTPEKICTSNHKNIYWSISQQLAHHTINGCNINAGDCMASGTISGDEPGSYGSMLEITWRGTKPLKLANGVSRKFLEDGDTIKMRAQAVKDHVKVGFGEVSATILPALNIL